MPRFLTSLRRSSLALFSVLVTAVPATASLEIHRFTRPFAVGDSQVVRIEAPAGQLEAHTWDDTSVGVEVKLDCTGDVGSCRAAARKVALASERSGDALIVQMTGPWTAEDKKQSKSKILKARGWYLSAEIKVFYPRSQHLEIHMERGAVMIKGLESSAKVWVEQGSAQVSMRKRDAGSMKLSCQKGKALIRRAGEQPLRGTKTLEWNEGDGECHLEVELGEGPIVVDLL